MTLLENIWAYKSLLLYRASSSFSFFNLSCHFKCPLFVLTCFTDTGCLHKIKQWIRSNKQRFLFQLKVFWEVFDRAKKLAWSIHSSFQNCFLVASNSEGAGFAMELSMSFQSYAVARSSKGVMNCTRNYEHGKGLSWRILAWLYLQEVWSNKSKILKSYRIYRERRENKAKHWVKNAMYFKRDI